MSPEPENLNVEVTIHDADTAVLAVGGELDLDTATLLHTHLANQIHHGRLQLVLDLSGLEFMDSSGLNTVIKATRETRQANGNLYLAAATPTVHRLLEITGMSAATPIHSSVDDALKAASSASGSTGEAP
ncbi:STAS domain-containing protein [Streptomyces flavidovirens]|uniref:STAS domain-containing protein n=1 Tax=Streptomyces flavidovirens TaxID=67298 RepID=UPI00342EBF21